MSRLVKLGHKLLSNSICYNAFQLSVGSFDYRKQIVSNSLSHTPNINVLDLGCGTGVTIPLLNSDQRFLGLDISGDYLKKAAEVSTHNEVRLREVNLGEKGWGREIWEGQVSTVLAMGIFHHLDDSTLLNCLEELGTNLEKGSMMYSMDPIVTPKTSNAAKWFASNDRGQFIRSADEYKDMFSTFGWELSFNYTQNRLRIPYDTIEINAKFVK